MSSRKVVCRAEGRLPAFWRLRRRGVVRQDRDPVVRHDRETREVEFNTRLHAFARHWRFRPRTCAPYRARPKAKTSAAAVKLARTLTPGALLRVGWHWRRISTSGLAGSPMAGAWPDRRRGSSGHITRSASPCYANGAAIGRYSRIISERVRLRQSLLADAGRGDLLRTIFDRVEL